MARGTETLRAATPTPAVAMAVLAPEGWYQRNESKLIGGVSVVGFMVVWQLVAFVRIVPPLFMPGPLDVVEAFGELIKEGKIWNDILVSGQEVTIGYGLAIVVGIPLGLAMGWYRRFSYGMDPFVNFFYSTPRIALLPLFIIWFGIGINSKIAVIFLGAFFPIVINTLAGVRNLDPALLKVAHSFGASDLHLFRTIALPGAVPFILTGLRLGVGHAMVGVVVGELVAARAGVGLMIAVAGSTFQTAKVFAGVVIIAGAGMVLTYSIGRLESRFERWRPRPTR